MHTTFQKKMCFFWLTFCYEFLRNSKKNVRSIPETSTDLLSKYRSTKRKIKNPQFWQFATFVFAENFSSRYAPTLIFKFNAYSVKTINVNNYQDSLKTFYITLERAGRRNDNLSARGRAPMKIFSLFIQKSCEILLSFVFITIF